MLLTSANLQAAFVGFNTAFQAGIGTYKPRRDLVAMTTKSTTRFQTYPWMKDISGFREWIGERVVNSIANHDFTIRNKSFENTQSVDRDDFEDDMLGTYSKLFESMGEEAARFPDRLVFDFLKNGNTKPCYDGQYLFDTDHPLVKPDGTVVNVANYIDGGGAPWFLLDLSRTLKPIVWQERRPFNKLVRMDGETDAPVFNRKELVYGSDGRGNVGAGLWQLGVMSKADLTHDNYAAAKALFATFKKDNTNDPLGIVPTHLVTGMANEGKARKVLISENKTGGESNEWKGSVQLELVPFLD